MPPTDEERFKMCSALSRKISDYLNANIPDGMEVGDVLATLFGTGIVAARCRGMCYESLQTLWEEILLSQMQAEGIDVDVKVIPPGGTTPVGSNGSVN